MRRVVAVIVLLMVASAGTGAAATLDESSVDAESAPASVQTQGNETTGNETGGNGSTAPLGATISSFMQSNAEQTDETVQRGMWTAAFNRSQGNARENLATNRVGELRERLANLSEERRALLAAWRNGTIDRVTFVARMSALESRIGALNGSVQETSEAVTRAEVDPPGLVELEEEARNASARRSGTVPDWVGADPPGHDEGGGPPGQNEDDDGPPGQDKTPPGQDDNDGGDGPPERAGSNSSVSGQAGDDEESPENRGNGGDPPGHDGDQSGPPGHDEDQNDPPGHDGNQSGPPGQNDERVSADEDEAGDELTFEDDLGHSGGGALDPAGEPSSGASGLGRDAPSAPV